MSRSTRRAPHRRSRRVFVQRLGAAAVALGAATALGSRPIQAATLAPTTAAPSVRQMGGTLTFVDPFEPKSYADGDIYVVREGIGEGLVRINFQSQFEGALATSWNQDDLRTWRFTLRPGVKFHNGIALDAGAVVASLQRLAESRNVAAAFRGAAITAVDTATVTIHTSTPTPYLPAILADSKAVIYEPSASFGSDGSLQPISTGPFKLADFRPGDRRVLEAHAGYWGGTPGVSQVNYLVVPQGQTRANMIRSGEADIARVLGPSDLVTLQASPSVRVMTVGLPRVRLMYLNTVGPNTGDVRVRRALAHAVDRETIVQTVLENQGVAQAGLFNAGYPWGNPSLVGLPFDQSAARTLLAEAGYGPSSPLSLTITTYSTRPELPGLAQVLQQMFAEVGVNAQINVVGDATVMEGAALRGEGDIALVARNTLFLFDPQAAFESDYFSTGSYNLSRYAAQDAQITAAGTTVDTSQRYALYRQMEQQIVEQDVPAIAMNSYIQIDAAQASVSGYQPHPTDYLAMTELVRKG